MKRRAWIISTLLMMIVCSLLFYYFYYYEKERIIEEMTQNQKNQAKLAANTFEEFIDKWNNELFYLTRQPNIITMNNDGQSDLEKFQAILKNEINSITRTDKYGKIIFTAPNFSNTIGRNISTQRHMKQILTDHMPVVSDVFMTVQGFQAIAIHYPVYQNGEYDGSLAYVINFKDIAQKVLGEIKTGNTGFAWMISEDGMIMTFPDSSKVGKSVYHLAKGNLDFINTIKIITSGQEGVVSYEGGILLNANDRSKRLAYYIPVKCNNKVWTIILSSEENEVVSSIYGYTEKLAVLVLVLLFGGMIFFYFGIKAWVIVRESEARKQIENELKESEKRYRLISSIASDYTFSAFINEDGNVYLDWVGDKFYDFTGYTKDEYNAIGGWRACLYPDDYVQDDNDMELLRNNQHVISEVRTIRKNGNVVWLKVYAHPIWDEKRKKLIGMYGGVQDIDKIKRAEEALKKSEEKFSKAFHSSPDSIVISKLVNGEIIELNEGFERIFGYKREEALGKTAIELSLFSDPDERQPIVEKVIKGEFPDTVEVKLKNKHGENKICNLHYSLIDFNGEQCMVVTVKDLTEFKKAEKTLKENEKKFRIAFDNAPSGMSMYGVDGHYLEVNPVFCKMLGYTREELLACSFFDITHLEDIEESRRWVKKIMSEDLSEPELEKRYLHKDGHIVWGLVRSKWIHYSDGKAQMAITHILDITERKNTEIALRETEYFLNRSQIVGQIGSYKMDIGSRSWISTLSLDTIFGIGTDFPRTIEGWLKLISPDDAELCQNHLLIDVLTKHYHFDLEYRIVRNNDRQLRWVHGLGELEYDSDGNPLKMIGTIQDITERKYNEIALRETEYFLNRSQEIGKIGAYKYDIANNQWITSSSLDIIFGIDNTANKTIEGWLSIIHSEDRESCRYLFVEEALKNKKRIDHEYRITRKNDNQERWVHGVGELEYDEKGNPSRIIGTIQDITDKKYASETLHKTNRQLRMLIDCNQALIRSNNENELLSSICKIIVETGGYSRVWVGYLGNDENKYVKPVAQYGFTDDYLKSLLITSHDTIYGRGPVGTAIRTGKPCIIKSVSNDPDFRPWRDKALENGINSVSAFPLKIGDEIFGSMNIDSATPDFLDDIEIRLLSELADDLAFGIAAIKTKVERERIADSLKHSENFLNTVIEQSPHPMWISDENGTLIKLNEACRELLHVKNEEVVGIYNLFNDDAVISQGAISLIKTVFEQGKMATFELRYDSSTIKHLKLAETVSIYLIVNISPVMDSQGKVINAIIQHTDITEREITENELRRLTRQNEEAMKMAQMGQWEYDVVSSKFIFNEDYYKLHGITSLPEGGFIVDADKFIQKYVDPRFIQILKNGIAQARLTSDPNFQYQTEIVVLKDDGESRDFNILFRIEKDKRGNTIKLHGVGQDITERKRSESLISASLRDKEVLLKEIYHRTKNNMWVISSILELQAESLDNKEARSVLKDTVNRIYSMALVHQKLYQSQNLSKIDLKNYIRDLLKLLVNAYEISSDKINLKMKLASVDVLIDSAIPLGLVINELITNSLKYAFPGDRKGEIEVNLSKNEQGEIKIEISDNGIGVKEEKLFNNIKSIGLKLIVEIVERQLKGKIKYDTSNGVSCSISFYDTLYTERV